jgi:hypothetical protein
MVKIHAKKSPKYGVIESMIFGILWEQNVKNMGSLGESTCNCKKYGVIGWERCWKGGLNSRTYASPPKWEPPLWLSFRRISPIRGNLIYIHFGVSRRSGYLWTVYNITFGLSVKLTPVGQIIASSSSSILPLHDKRTQLTFWHFEIWSKTYFC